VIMSDQEKSTPPPDTLTPLHEVRSLEKEMEKQRHARNESESKETQAKEQEEDYISIAPSRASTCSEHSDISKKGEQTTNSRPIDLSRTTSVTPEAVIVERSQRRGLFARFALIPEVENPVHYARRTKWFITFIVAFCAMAAPMGSAIVMPVLQDISKAFGSSPTVTNMTVAVYMLSMGIFPLWWSSFSERLGRRTICEYESHCTSGLY
jgi:hypothetical protein